MPTLSNDWQPRDERDARIEELEAEVERSHKAILALTGENEQLRAALRDCAQLADDAIRACITNEEQNIATTIRNLILSRYPESHKALKGGSDAE